MERNAGNRIGSVDRALELLLVLKRGEVLRVSDAAEALHVAPSTAHRLLATLCDRGFAAQDAHRRYRAGPELLSAMPPSAIPLPDLVRAMRPHVEWLFDALAETVHLFVLAGTFVRFVDGIEGNQALRVGLRIGVRLPAHSTSAGKAMLAELEPDAVRRLYPAGLPRWTDSAHSDLDALLDELALIRRQGYGVNREESEAGVCAVGCALRGGSGRPLAGISVALPASRFDDGTRTGPKLLQARTAAERTLAKLHESPPAR